MAVSQLLVRVIRGVLSGPFLICERESRLARGLYDDPYPVETLGHKTGLVKWRFRRAKMLGIAAAAFRGAVFQSRSTLPRLMASISRRRRPRLRRLKRKT